MNAGNSASGLEVAFVSDLHLCSEDPAGIREATDFLETCAGRFAELYILGDLFDCWLGHTSDFAEDNSMQRFFRALKAAGQSMLVLLMRGNHDFMVSRDFAREHNCRLLSATTHRVEIGRRRLLLLHGHTLSSNDKGLQWLHRLFIASRICPWMLAQLPFGMRAKIGDMFMGTSTEQRRSPKPKKMIRAVEERVRQLCHSHRCDLMIHGHFHRAAEHPIDCPPSPATRICLGFWRGDKSGEIVVANGSGEVQLVQLARIGWDEGGRNIGDSKIPPKKAKFLKWRIRERNSGATPLWHARQDRRHVHGHLDRTKAQPQAEKDDSGRRGKGAATLPQPPLRSDDSRPLSPGGRASD